jgi:HPt (histidine-containing phosphotransfer) domain-containing protein
MEEQFQDFNPGVATESAVIFGADDTGYDPSPSPVLETSVSAPPFVTVAAGLLPLDIESALPRFFNDRQFFLEMCKEYLSSLPNRVADLRDALKSGEGNRVYRLGHNLKGVSSNFSAGPVTKIGAELEALGSKEDLDQAAFLVEQLENEVQRLITYCKEEFAI